MHLSDTLVLGPLPLGKQPLRLPLGAALAGLVALLLAGAAAAALLILRPVPAPVATLATHLPITLPGLAPIPTLAPPGIPVRVASIPVVTAASPLSRTTSRLRGGRTV